MTAPTVKVKPLEWGEVQTYGGKVWDASPSTIYPYRIVHYIDERNCFSVNALPHEKHDTLEAAKAAAQADYEARILSAIDATDLDALIGAVLAEAADSLIECSVWCDSQDRATPDWRNGVVDARKHHMARILALNTAALTALDRAKREARVEGMRAAKARINARPHVDDQREYQQGLLDAMDEIDALIAAERDKP